MSGRWQTHDTMRGNNLEVLRSRSIFGATVLVSLLAVLTGGHAAALEGRTPQTSGGISGSGELIAYERGARVGPSEIFLMNADGTDQHRLARGHCFAWSPDGRKIAFFADGIYVINVDGTGRQRLLSKSDLTFNPPWYSQNGGWQVNYCEELGLDWSPDGRKIAVGGARGIIATKADGTGTSRLTSANDSLPRWSPGGRKIVFQRVVGEHGGDIFVCSADGSGLRRLTFTHHFQTGTPSWSPDGRKIAYVSAPLGKDIFIMNADGSGQRNITRTPYGGADDESPSWSPAGDKILFETNGTIHALTLEGHRHRNLTRGDRGSDAYPQWSPDGRSIIFARATRYQWDVYVMTSDGEDVVNLTNTPRPIFDRAPSSQPTKR